jgi:integrase
VAKKIDYASLFTLRKDGRYQTSYVGASGDRKYLYDRDPEALYIKLQAAQEPKPVTFKEVAEEWQTQHREQITERTWKNYEPHYKNIVAMHGKKPVEGVTALDVMQDLKRAKAKGYSATIVNTRRSLYKMIFDHAIISGSMIFNPVAAVSLPKGLKRGRRQAPSDDVIKIILANTDKPFGLFPFLLLCTGLRKSEALALTWDDIDFENKTISITKSIDYYAGSKPKIKEPKTESSIRQVPLISILETQLKAQPKNNIYLFPAPPSNRAGEGGGLMTERGYEGSWLRYCQSVGLIDDDGKPTITAHNLRHGTATLMFESGVDELTAQRVLGHSKIEVTREIYTQLRDAQQAKSIGRLNSKLVKLMSESR